MYAHFSTQTMSSGQSKFKKIIQKKTKLKLKNDSSDTLIYLIYLDYINRLVKESLVDGQLDTTKLKNNNLVRKYKG